MPSGAAERRLQRQGRGGGEPPVLGDLAQGVAQVGVDDRGITEAIGPHPGRTDTAAGIDRVFDALAVR